MIFNFNIFVDFLCNFFRYYIILVEQQSSNSIPFTSIHLNNYMQTQLKEIRKQYTTRASDKHQERQKQNGRRWKRKETDV